MLGRLDKFTLQISFSWRCGDVEQEWRWKPISTPSLQRLVGIPSPQCCILPCPPYFFYDFRPLHRLQSKHFATIPSYDNTLPYTLGERYLAKQAISAIKLSSGGSRGLDAGGNICRTCLFWERERKRSLSSWHWNGVHKTNAGLLGTTNT